MGSVADVEFVGSSEVDVVRDGSVSLGLGRFFRFFLSMPALPLSFRAPPEADVYSEEGI